MTSLYGRLPKDQELFEDKGHILLAFVLHWNPAKGLTHERNPVHTR